MLTRRFFVGSGVAGVGLVTGGGCLASEPLLTVDGNIENGPQYFPDERLSRLPQISFDTSTLWSEGVRGFSGPALETVLSSVGAKDGEVFLTAVNDYSISIPRSVIEETVPIVANRLDGNPFGVRQKGPLWIIFPYDHDAKYRTESIYSYSIWQLTQISILS